MQSSLSQLVINRFSPQIWLAKLLFHRPMVPPSLKLFLSIPVLVSSAEILQTPLLTVPSASLALHLGATSLARHPKELLQARRAWNVIRQGLDPFGSNVVSKRLQKMLAEVAMSMKPLAAPRLLNLKLTDTTCKMMVGLQGEASVESVLLRMGKHCSLCVSSQVGCKQACVFCATGKMGELRNLTAHEILSQVWLAHRQCRGLGWPRVRNLVFMGMGEPANNLEAVATALQLLTDAESFGISRCLITVSTVAPSPQHVLQLSDLSCRLAWSIHAGKDSVRKQLVPSARYTAEQLRDAFLECIQRRPARYQQLICEVVLLDGVNTAPEDAAAVADLLSPFERDLILINLIPYNDIGDLLPENYGGKPLRYRTPPVESVRQFQRSLWQRGFACSVRQTRGDGKASACGQLALVGAAVLAKMELPSGFNMDFLRIFSVFLAVIVLLAA